MTAKQDQTHRHFSGLGGVSNIGYLPKRLSQIELTRHAAKRCQQRAISPESARLVKAFGERSFDGHGGIRYLMTQDSTKSLGRAIGLASAADRMVGLYLVVSAIDDQTVIAVGHRET